MKRLALAIARDRGDHDGPIGLQRHACKGLAILHGPAPLDVASPGLETIQGYASTVAALHARETILPLRFGSLHQSEAELDAWLRVHADDWRASLDEVEGCDEMGLRVLLNPPLAVARPTAPIDRPDRPGTAYLEALRARRSGLDGALVEAERLTGQILEAVGLTCRRATVEGPGPGRERLLSLTFLVLRKDIGRFLETLKAVDGLDPGRSLSSGPWPPYSFAGPVTNFVENRDMIKSFENKK